MAQRSFQTAVAMRPAEDCSTWREIVFCKGGCHEKLRHSGKTGSNKMRGSSDVGALTMARWREQRVHAVLQPPFLCAFGDAMHQTRIHRFLEGVSLWWLNQPY